MFQDHLSTYFISVDRFCRNSFHAGVLRQPFRDGTELTRYWRNTPAWKEFRQNLSTLMKYVER